MSDKRHMSSGRTPSAWTGSLYYLVFFLMGGSYIPFLYVYFADLGLSGKQIGLLATLAPIATMVLSTPLASLADRTRRRVRITQIGFACLGVIVFLLRFPTTFIAIVPLMLAQAVFAFPFSSIGDGLVARMARRNQLNYGAMRLWGSVGFALSAQVCGVLWQLLGLRIMFIVAGLLFVPLIAITGRLEEGPVISSHERRPASQLLRDQGLLLLLVATFLSGISNSLALTFSGVYARWLGGGDILVGAMVAVSALAELPTMFFSDRFSRWIKETNAVVCAYAVMGLAFLGYALNDNPNLLPIFSVIKGLGYGVWLTVTIRLVVKRTSEQWASTAQALLTMCLWGLAPLVAGPLGGLIHDVVSPAAVFVLAAVTLGLAGGVVLLASWRGKLD